MYPVTGEPRESAPLRLPQIIALYIGSVLGCGILILPGLVADLAGPASLLSWGIMAVLVVPMSLTMGLLSVQYPNDGGVSHFVATAFNPQIGSLIGWFFLLSVVIGVPVLALTGAGYLSAAFGLPGFWRVFIAAGILGIGIIMNYFGMRMTGQVQIIVVLTTIIIIVVACAGSFADIDSSLFTPFIPNGWESVGHATTLVFWCFIGWEAISHISEEFEDPRRDVVRATLIAAVIISVLYILTAIAVIGTGSYGNQMSEVSLMHLVNRSFGSYGVIIAGIASLFVCVAPAIAYIGATSRLVYSLAVTGYAPAVFARLSVRYATPVGGLAFLVFSFLLLLGLFYTGLLPLATLIQVPNATFILTYLGGCAAGIVLLRENRLGFAVSVVSLILSVVVFLFVSWAVLFPVFITVVWYVFLKLSKKKGISGLKKGE
jgi:amino acid efflux transporter